MDLGRCSNYFRSVATYFGIARMNRRLHIQRVIQEGSLLTSLVLDLYLLGSASLGNSHSHGGSQGNLGHDRREKKRLVMREK